MFGKGQDFAAKITYRSRSQGDDPKKLLAEFRDPTVHHQPVAPTRTHPTPT
ncbi:MAG: hypothetical protein ACRDRH_06475 [Pseudonocardia sp.]